MNYLEFRDKLQNHLEDYFSDIHANVEMYSVNKSNQTLDAMSIRTDGSMVAPTIYPERLYEQMQAGASFREVAEGAAYQVQRAMMMQPEIPELTPEKARESISFSLVNADKNKELLKDCPYKKVHDLAAVPRWHISDEASFVVNNNVMSQLRMTKEEVLSVAQENTEGMSFSVRGMNDVMKEMMINDGIPEEYIADMMPPETPFYVITNASGVDGSSAILSDSFMQSVSEKIGCEEFYVLPSSRHEVLAVDPAIVQDTADLKQMVMEVNSTEVSAEDFLSDSIYKYNGKTHTLSMADEKGIFHDMDGAKAEITKISKGMGR